MAWTGQARQGDRLRDLTSHYASMSCPACPGCSSLLCVCIYYFCLAALIR